MSRCAECQLPIYYRGKRDEVGRWTSDGEWTHWSKDANNDHAAITVKQDEEPPLTIVEEQEAAEMDALVRAYARRKYTARLQRAVNLGVIDRDQMDVLIQMWNEEYAPLDFAERIFEDEDG